jgi:hypothetical protein
MNSIRWFTPGIGILVVLYLCLSSYVLHFGFASNANSAHQDTNVTSALSPENVATDPHPEDDDIKTPGEIIPGTEERKSAQEWSVFLPALAEGSDRLTPPPKINLL